MSVNYNKLWKLLIDKEMKKQDLQKMAGLSKGTITKLGKNEDVNTHTLIKICDALQCDIGDIVENRRLNYSSTNEENNIDMKGYIRENE